MPSFHYRARTPDGELQSGVVEASSRAAAVTILQQHHLIITSLTETSPGTLKGMLAMRARLFGRVSRKEIVAFSRQLSVLLEANVPLLEALQAIAEQTTNARFLRIVQTIISDVDSGTALSDAFAKHPRQFSSFYVNMVRSGEASGKLQEVFSFLAEYLERQYAAVMKIRGAFLYPALVLVSLALVAAYMVFVVLPKILVIFEETGALLPLPTRILFGTVALIRRIWWIVAVAAASLVYGFMRLTRSGDGRLWRDAQMLHFPLFGGIYRSMLISRFVDNLGTLIAAGIPIVQALEVTAGVVSNMVFREIIGRAIEGVQRGEPLHETLRTAKALPPTVIQMIAVGERTGRLDMVLSHVARFYQRDVETKMQSLIALIEPALIVIVGIAIGIFVAAILLPIYTLSVVSGE